MKQTIRSPRAVPSPADAIVQGTGYAITSLNTAGIIQSWNAGAERVFGYTAEEALGQSLDILLPPEQQGEFHAIYQKVKAEGEQFLEAIRVTKHGRRIVASLAISPVRDAAGQMTGIASIIQDVTERKQADEAFRRNEIQYRLLFERNPMPMWVFDRQTLRFLAVNRAAISQYGYTEAEFLNMTILQIRPPETVPLLLEDVAARHQGLQKRATWEHKRKDGETIDVEIVCHDLEFEGAEAMLVAAYDVTEKLKAEEAARLAEARYRSIFDEAVIGIFQHTPDGRPTHVNRAFARMHGFDSPEQLMAGVQNAGSQAFVDPGRMAELCRQAEREVVRNAEIELYRRDRTRMWVLVNLRAVRDASGAVVLFEGTAEDITDRKAAEAQVRFLAYHDALTGLPNRALFQDRLDHALASARRHGHNLAVFFFDLDRFKYINDSLGHSVGDEMLRDVAARLSRTVREQDTVARVGGDEFLIMVDGISQKNDAELAARRILEAMARPFQVHHHLLSTSCSIGISMFPEHGEDGETLIRNADAAMYRAKEDGVNHVRFFSEEMNRLAVARLTLENNLRSALDRQEFRLVYQPQMELATGRIIGIEALLRWDHPTLGPVPPNEFIPVAENSGLILPIGEWVMRTACAQVRAWQQRGLPVVPVAVNVSAVQFRHQEFCSRLRSTLAQTGLAPELLELELTESLLLTNADVMRAVMEELRELGVALAIDDFGTGYSSLSYLKQFRVKKLKIDGSFIRDIAFDGDDAAITTAIVSMGRSLNLYVVAEGVETETQLAFLRQRGCHAIQGYHFSRPLPPDILADLLLASQTGAWQSPTTPAGAQASETAASL